LHRLAYESFGSRMIASEGRFPPFALAGLALPRTMLASFILGRGFP
jgi:hypothetical protein